MENNMEAIIKGFEAEIEMQERRYRLAIEHAIERLQGYAARETASTHLGHNLANHATELSEIAARIEAAKMALAFIKEQK
jgi:hypothetical protein